MRFYDWSSARSADAAKKSAVAKPSVNRSSTGANSSYASEERFWLCWKRAQLVAVLNSQARAPCARASSRDLRKSASAENILSGPAPFKSISASARAAFQPRTKRLGPVRRGRPPPRSRILRKAYSVDPGATSSTPHRRAKCLGRGHAQPSIAAPK
jgi:hypothetical protein